MEFKGSTDRNVFIYFFSPNGIKRYHYDEKGKLLSLVLFGDRFLIHRLFFMMIYQAELDLTIEYDDSWPFKSETTVILMTSKPAH